MIDTSVDEEEVLKFSKLADEWWDENGKFKILHTINPVRMEYIVSTIENYFHKPASECNIIDVGCGGGLISESLCRIGSQVTAIDASSENIEVAKIHAQRKKLDIKYLHTTIESLSTEYKDNFDILVCMEVIEHVQNIAEFIRNCCSVIKPGGLFILSTLNRNVKSFLLSIVMAEYILQWVPKKTHQYEKFLKPSEISKLFRNNQFSPVDIKGMEFSLLSRTWSISHSPSVNYLMVHKKEYAIR